MKEKLHLLVRITLYNNSVLRQWPRGFTIAQFVSRRDFLILLLISLQWSWKEEGEPVHRRCHPQLDLTEQLRNSQWKSWSKLQRISMRVISLDTEVSAWFTKDCFVMAILWLSKGVLVPLVRNLLKRYDKAATWKLTASWEQLESVASVLPKPNYSNASVFPSNDNAQIPAKK